MKNGTKNWLERRMEWSSAGSDDSRGAGTKYIEGGVLKIGNIAAVALLCGISVAHQSAALAQVTVQERPATADTAAPQEKNGASKRVFHYKTLLQGPFAQRYEIELFDNGDVVYTGIGNVNRMGAVKWRVERDHIESLVQKIWPQFTPPSAKEIADAERRGPNPGGGVVAPPPAGRTDVGPEVRALAAKLRLWYLEIVNRGEVRVLSQGIGNPPFDKWLRESLEQVVPTKFIRCPFPLVDEFRLGPRVLPIGFDVCKFEEEIDGHTPNFIPK